eukprot:g11818.t1
MPQRSLTSFFGAPKTSSSSSSSSKMDAPACSGSSKRASPDSDCGDAAGGEPVTAAAGAGAGGEAGAKRAKVAGKVEGSPIKEEGWAAALARETSKPYFGRLQAFLDKQYASKTIYPPRDKLFNAFESCPLGDVKVVILGQDPYHQPGQAHGLAFSVMKGVPQPPSLRNMIKEAVSCCGITPTRSGTLDSWCRQGVLLLNTVLSVENSKANSHKNQGWETFTDAVVRELNNGDRRLVFLLWGKPSQKKGALIDSSKHRVLTCAHPSPLSATRKPDPFIGSECFKKANEALEELGHGAVDWNGGEKEASGAMPIGKKHRLTVEVEDGKMRVVVERGATVGDLQAAVQRRLDKTATAGPNPPLVREIRERPLAPAGSTVLPEALLLDNDDALSDLMDGDTEAGTTFVAVLESEGGGGAGAAGASAPGAAGDDRREEKAVTGADHLDAGGPPVSPTANSVASTVSASGAKGSEPTVPFRTPPAAAVAPTGPHAAPPTPETVPPVPPAAAAATATAAAVAKAEAAAAVAKAEAAAAVAKAEAASAAATAEAAAAAAAAAKTSAAAPYNRHATPANPDDDEAARQTENMAKTGLPFSIPYTVAGMPRASAATAGGGMDRRGPREGMVTAYTGWTLRDLKVGIARQEGVAFTPDADPVLSASDNAGAGSVIDVNVTVAPNVVVPMKVRPTQTVRDLWRMSSCAAAAAPAADLDSAGSPAGLSPATVVAKAASAVRDLWRMSSEGGAGENAAGTKLAVEAVVAKATAAAAAAAAAAPRGRKSNGSERDAGGGDEADAGEWDEAFALPRGQVLVRQKEAGAAATATAAAAGVPANDQEPLPLSQCGAGGSVCFPDDVLGSTGCRLEDGENLVLVGPGAVPADEAPFWAVRVLVLGQLVGFVSIPNPRLPAAGARQTNAEQTNKLRTVGGLRALVGRRFKIKTEKADLWIAPPAESGGGGARGGTSRGAGMQPTRPCGKKASMFSDNKDLEEYGLAHLAAVDVRVRPEVRPASRREQEEDVVRIKIRTNGMLVRGEEGPGLFVSKSTFSSALLKRLATCALKVAPSSVTRVTFDKQTARFSRCDRGWLSEYGEELSKGAGLVMHVNVPTAASLLVGRKDLAVSGASAEEMSVRMTVSLWVEEPCFSDADPIGISGGDDGNGQPFDASTVYPLRSTYASDGAPLGDWGLLRAGVRVFAVFYMTRSPLSASEAAVVRPLYHREVHLGTSLRWHSRPVPPPLPSSGNGSRSRNPGDADSEDGKACFLSCMYMLCEHLRELQRQNEEAYSYGGSNSSSGSDYDYDDDDDDDYDYDDDDDDDDDDDTEGWLQRELMALLSPRFPPAALALQQLVAADDVTDAECACVAQILWGLAREMAPPSVADANVLENSRAFLSWLVTRAATAREDAERERSRQLAIRRRKDASAEVPRADPAVWMAVNSVLCCRLVERLEPGYAVCLKVNGKMLDGVYSTGGAQQKRQELNSEWQKAASKKDKGGRGGGGGRRGGGRNSARPQKVEVVPWAAAGRVLLSCPFTNKLQELRFTVPTDGRASARGTKSEAEGEEASSWLSLVDWEACLRRSGDHSFFRVIGPLSLGTGPSPSLTRDREGRLCVFLRKGKDLERCLQLFSPLKGGRSTTEDGHVLAQCLERIRESKGYLPGGEFEEAVTAARAAREGIMVCIDTSYSMAGKPDFEDDEETEEEEEKRRKYRPEKLLFDWAEPPPHETADKTANLRALLEHKCLPQLQEVAGILNTQYGEWEFGHQFYPEMVLEELVLENFDPDCPKSWEKAIYDIKVYRRHRPEFLDVLLKTGRYGDSDPVEGGEDGEEDISNRAPDQFRCPITQDLMDDPVVAEDGHSYERSAIEEWFANCGSNPRSVMTNAPLQTTNVMSNHALKSRIRDWREEFGRGSARGAGGRARRRKGGGGGGDGELGGGGGKKLSRRQARAAAKGTGAARGQSQPEGAPSRKPGGSGGGSGRSRDAGRGPSSSAFTVKIQGYTMQPLLLPSRRGETNFSIKLRLWALYHFKRPSMVELWYGLKDFGDSGRRGVAQANGACPSVPGPEEARAAAAAAAAEGVHWEKGLCVLEHYLRDPYQRLKTKPEETISLTRQDAVKQILHAFINRSQAYDLPNEMGLISFGSDVHVPCRPTHVLEDFREKVDALTAYGDTKLWDAISEACTVLEKWREEWREKAEERAAERLRKKKSGGLKGPNAGKEEEPILRIMVLSDGNDTKSRMTAHGLCGRLQKAGVVVDSITVGKERNERLKCLSLATGGYAFHPTTLRSALRLNEQETVLSAGQRARQPPTSRAGRVSTEAQLLTRERLEAAHDTEETATLKEDPMARSTCRPIADALATLDPADRNAGGSEASKARGGDAGSGGGGSAAAKSHVGGGGIAIHPERQRRVQREMMDWMRNPHEAFEVFPSDENMHFWKVVLTGPASTPYSGGCWLLSMFFPNNYPSAAPRVRFVTPIRHCNINSHGRVCHALFDRSWTPNTSVFDVLSCVYGLLLVPDHDDPLDSTLALQMYVSDYAYETAIEEHVKAHACKPKHVLVAEIEGAQTT